MNRETLEQRAIKTGVKASKKRGHLVSPQELLSLRVQIMPAAIRIALVLAGILLLLACGFAWPVDSNGVQATEAVFGIFAILFGAFGVRRTLSNLVDSFDSIDFASAVIDMIGEVISGIDL